MDKEPMIVDLSGAWKIEDVEMIRGTFMKKRTAGLAAAMYVCTPADTHVNDLSHVLASVVSKLVPMPPSSSTISINY